MIGLWNLEPLLIGVVHLLPLPGSPRFGGDRRAILAAALADAESYLDNGIEAILVENFGDVPFRKDHVGANVVAEMTRVATELVVLAAGCPVGVNVLRNDAEAAIAVAAASGGHFIRVNVHTGVMFSDQGMIEGDASRTLRLRETYGRDLAILADVFVKHAVPPAGSRLEDAAADTVERGLADAVIVTGRKSGIAPILDDVRKVRAAVGGTPVLVGSGVSAANLREVLEVANGAIIGTSLKIDGVIDARVDPERVRELVEASR